MKSEAKTYIQNVEKSGEMNQIVKDAIAYLKYYKPRIVSQGTGTGMFKKVSYVTDNTIPQKNILYLGFSSQTLYRLRFMEDMTLFLIRDQADEEKSIDYHGNCVVYFPQETAIEQLYEECKRFLDIQGQLVESAHTLMEIYLTDGSLQSLVDAAAGVIENPVMLIDNSYKVLCDSKNIVSDDLQWEENISRGYWSYEFVSQFNKISEIQSIKKNDTPFMSGCAMSPLRRCINKLYIDRKQVGYLLSIESNCQFNDFMMQFLKYACRLISKELAYSAMEKGIERNVSIGNILIDVLDGKIQSREILRDCFCNTDIRLDSRYYLVLVDIENYNSLDKRIESLNHLLKKQFPMSLLVCRRNEIVLLIDLEDPIEAVIAKMRDIETVLRKKDLKVMISDQFQKLYEIHQYYRELTEVKEIGRLMDEKDVVWKYENLRIYTLLKSKVTEENVMRMIGAKEQALYSYDKEHGTEYFKTLYYYVKNGRSPQTTADELFIHKNTVTYRIGKARELFNIDLSDMDLCIRIYIAYKILQLKDNGFLADKTGEKE